MATLVATLANPVTRTFYERLIANGKEKKVALIAGMRKRLVILNSMIRYRNAWQVDFRSPGSIVVIVVEVVDPVGNS